MVVVCVCGVGGGGGGPVKYGKEYLLATKVYFHYN